MFVVFAPGEKMLASSLPLSLKSSVLDCELVDCLPISDKFKKSCDLETVQHIVIQI